MRKAYDTVKDADVIVTWPQQRDDLVVDIKEYAEFNREFLNDMRAAKKAGKSVDQVASTWTIPAKYAGYVMGPEGRLKANVQVIYDELK